ncbi:MAG: PH domain-containing protein, partial [Nocardioides sp.]|nr:PH domain-containing protein [Nocardioides sp.]
MSEPAPQPEVQVAGPVDPQLSEWQRLDPRMLLVHPVKEITRFLVPLVAVFIAGRASGGGAPWELLGVLFPIALGLMRYLTTSFRIAGGRVELRRGLLDRHVLSTPLDRVRTVDLTASPIHRLLGLTTLRIGTGIAAPGEDNELDLDGLPAERARALRADLLHAAPVAGDDRDTGSAPEPAVLSLDLAWLRFAPLTSSGVVVTAGLVGAAAQVLSTAGEGVEVDSRSWDLGVPGWTVLALGALVVVVLVSAVSVAGYLVTNWGFSLSRGRGAWHLRRGLFTTRETSLDESRVAGVTVSEPLGLRLAGGGRLSAIVTGLGSGQGGSSILVPPAPRDVLQRVAGVVLGDDAPVHAPLTGHGPAAQRRRWTRALGGGVVLAGLVAVGVVLAGGGWWAVLGLGLPLLAVPLAADRVRSLGHTLSDGYVVARSGSLARRRDHLGVDDVIGWNLRATWFQRRVGLTSLVATTAGGRQSVTILDVPEPLAVAL